MIMAAGELRQPQGHEFMRPAGLPVWTLIHYASGNMRFWTSERDEPADIGRGMLVLVRAAVAFISDHCAAPLCVTRIAQHVSMSASHFAHCFREQTGMSPMAFVEQQRLEQAKDLLLHTNLRMKEIAARTGFANACHFSFRFHKRTGRKPSVFRMTAGGHPEKIGEQRGHPGEF